MSNERIPHSVGKVTGEEIGRHKGAVSSHLFLSSVRMQSQPSMGTVRLRERGYMPQSPVRTVERLCVWSTEGRSRKIKRNFQRVLMAGAEGGRDACKALVCTQKY